MGASPDDGGGAEMSGGRADASRLTSDQVLRGHVKVSECSCAATGSAWCSAAGGELLLLLSPDVMPTSMHQSGHDDLPRSGARTD